MATVVDIVLISAASLTVNGNIPAPSSEQSNSLSGGKRSKENYCSEKKKGHRHHIRFLHLKNGFCLGFGKVF